MNTGGEAGGERSGLDTSLDRRWLTARMSRELRRAWYPRSILEGLEGREERFDPCEIMLAIELRDALALPLTRYMAVSREDAGVDTDVAPLSFAALLVFAAQAARLSLVDEQLVELGPMPAPEPEADACDDAAVDVALGGFSGLDSAV